MVQKVLENYFYMENIWKNVEKVFEKKRNLLLWPIKIKKVMIIT